MMRLTLYVPGVLVRLHHSVRCRRKVDCFVELRTDELVLQGQLHLRKPKLSARHAQ
jgi:hypothetical protein